MQYEKYTFEDLLKIMELLRSEDGCPWDREQTHESIKNNLLEEASEAKEAIESGIPEKIYDELGDVLMQVVFHAQIAKEAGEFDISDVINAVCCKLWRRHPHVFGDAEIKNSKGVLEAWKAIKKQEKNAEANGNKLDRLTKEEIKEMWHNAIDEVNNL